MTHNCAATCEGQNSTHQFPQPGAGTPPEQNLHAVARAPGSPQPSFITSAGEVDWCESVAGAISGVRGQSQGEGEGKEG